MGSTGTRRDADSVAKAEAVTWLWQNRNAPEPVLRRLIRTDTTYALIVAHGTAEDIAARTA
jgi:hypothetical protein